MLKARINLVVNGGAAKPNPKMGQALGPLGINMMQFCKELNEKTADYRPDIPLRIQLRAFTDRTYTYKVKPPATTWFLKKVTGMKKFSGKPGHLEVGRVPIQYIYEIAKVKKSMDEDMDKISEEDIAKMIIGQCSSLGVIVSMDDSLEKEPIFIDF